MQLARPASAGRAEARGMDDLAYVGVTSDPVAGRILGLRIRVPQPGRDRTAHAGQNRKANGTDI